MATRPSPEMLQQLFMLRDQLDAAPHGTTMTLMEAFAARIGKSVNTVNTWLKEHAGRKTGRKTRSDSGTSCVPTEHIEMLASLKREDVRGNGNKILKTGVALNIMSRNNVEILVSPSRYNALMRERKLDADSIINSRSHISTRAPHVNHTLQVDPSLCVIFYMGGKQKMMRDDEFYKNKMENFAKVKMKVWRYVRWEQASSSIDVRYYEAAGENQESLFEFLHYTMTKQPTRLSYGKPVRIEMDKGSANTSHGILNWLQAMDVEVITHAAGHSWAKGGVENANWLVETHYESRLKFEPVDNVDQLNASSANWVRDFNANAIEHCDCRVKRASGEAMVRDELWQLILRTPEHLIEIPEISVCRYFMHTKQDTRILKSNYMITFVHPEIGKSRQYCLKDWAEYLHNKMELRVWALLLKGGALRVEIPRIGAEPLLVEVQADNAFDEFGNSMTAQVKGEYRASPYSLTEANEKRLAQVAYGDDATRDSAEVARAKQVKPFAAFNEGKGLVAHSHLGKEELPQRLLPAATPLVTDQITAARLNKIEFPPLSLVEFATSMGSDWKKEYVAIVMQRYPDKRIPSNDVDALKERLLRGNLSPLRAVS